MKGYWNRILMVDLGREESRVERFSEDFPYMWLGGFGFGARLLFDMVKEINPLSPDNILMMCPGLLTATGIPTASKTVFVSKSPLTGGFGRSVAGAKAGVSLKKAGYDLMVITGKAEDPSVIVVDDNSITVESTDTWSFKVRDTREKLRKQYGKEFNSVIIGPAGEKLSRIASIDCDERQAGRGGLGAVMGSKNLKAILVKGSKSIEVYDENKLGLLIKEWRVKLVDHPAAKADMDYGTGEFYDWINRMVGVFPSRNWQYGYFQKVYDVLKEGERSHLDPYYWVPRYAKKKTACPGCNKPCGKWFVVENGKYACEVDGVEYETQYSLGANLEIDDIEAVAKANELCDQYGLDTISTGLTISWAMEAVEKGILSENDLEVKLSFGDAESVLRTIELMGSKEGKIGKLLGDGVKHAVETIKNGEEFAIHVKGMELPAYDVRGAKGIALAFAVSYRGGCHLTACVYGTELGGRWWTFEGVDRWSIEEKGYEVKVHEDLMAVYDALGVCKFSRHMFYGKGFLDVIHAVTGMTLSIGDLMSAGERIINIIRAFNVREGMGRKDDTLPLRVMHEPIPEGKSKGGIILEKELDEMLKQYYQARGWDSEGRPTRTKLHILGLDDVAESLYG
jgi:aldehyde:ferredoxin oxidoreductase